MPDSDRGLSDLLGFVFVFALVAATVGIISTAGFDSLREAREAEQLQNAERAFDVLVDNIEDIHRRGAPSRGTEIDVTDGSIYVGDPVTFNVSGTDTSTGNSFVVEREVHPIVYEESGDTRLRYAGGAVIREENQGSVVLEEPPFLLGADGVVVPVIRTTPTRVINVGGGTILLRTLHEGTTIEEASGDPVYDEFWINVTSDRRDAWRRTLSDYSATDCRTPAPDRVACELTVTPDRVYVTVVEIKVALEL